MSCYQPLKRFLIGTNPNTGKTVGKIYPFSVDHLEQIGGNIVPSESKIIDFTLVDRVFRDYQEIPCGKCDACKMAHAREWADRLLMEYTEFKKAIFLTLTYDDDDLVYNGLRPTLFKKDPQDFLKRLREHFSDRKLRFYLSGEYGSKTFRPHYHLIVFGLSLDDFPDREIYKITKLGFVLYKSDTMQRIWKHGYAPFSVYTYKTGAYVARYITKKVKDDPIFYESLNVLPPYATMSLKPGIGSGFYEKHKTEYLNTSKLFISDDDSSVQVGFPKYLKNKLKEECPEGWLERECKAADAREFAEEMELLETSLDRQTYLKNKEASFKQKIKVLSLSEFE